MKTFEDWRSETLERTFGLERVKNHPILTEWLAANSAPVEDHQKRLNSIQAFLIDNVEYWNETELREEFIVPLTGMIGFTNGHFKTFRERPLSATRPDKKGKPVELKGRVEWIVAQGKSEPRQPYFFLHEYKQERRKETEPLGQLLSAMLAAQTLNRYTFPLYGCYVVGRLWFFVILTGNEYAVSLAYDATRPDLSDIYSILKETRKYIEETIAKYPDEE